MTEKPENPCICKAVRGPFVPDPNCPVHSLNAVRREPGEGFPPIERHSRIQGQVPGGSVGASPAGGVYEPEPEPENVFKRTAGHTWTTAQGLACYLEPEFDPGEGLVRVFGRLEGQTSRVYVGEIKVPPKTRR